MAKTMEAITIDSKLIYAASRALWWLRQVSGDAAYENYLRCVLREPASGPGSGRKLLTRREFYLDSIRRRYSTPSRCC